jgi:RNA polymerase sigma-70 factor (ECF subfamily)
MNPDDLGQALERCRPYLRLLAQLNGTPRLAAKLDASDLVQQTLLQAYQCRAQYRGQTDEEFRAWLRQILTRNLLHAARNFGRAKRDVAQEQSLEAAMEGSSVRVENWLAAEQSSPSVKAQRHEQEARLTEALAALNEEQRQSVILHYWHDWSVAAIAEALERSPAAVAGLLKRGLQQLRRHLKDGNES